MQTHLQPLSSASASEALALVVSSLGLLCLSPLLKVLGRRSPTTRRQTQCPSQLGGPSLGCPCGARLDSCWQSPLCGDGSTLSLEFSSNPRCCPKYCNAILLLGRWQCWLGRGSSPLVFVSLARCEEGKLYRRTKLLQMFKMLHPCGGAACETEIVLVAAFGASSCRICR